MFEGFHPRDHLECLLAAQGVAAHCGVMDAMRRAMLSNTPDLVAVKQRASAVQMARMFSNVVRDLERRQSKPLPKRPASPPESSGSGSPPDDPLVPGDPTPAASVADDPKRDDLPVKPPRAKRGRAKTRATDGTDIGGTGPEPNAEPRQTSCQADPLQEQAPNLDDMPEWPEDISTRPDGSPGGLTAYVPKAPVADFIPREAPIIMVALATRGKPWRMVNIPADQANADPGQDPVSPVITETADDLHSSTRGPLDLRERVFTGDALARFASARFDPNAPVEPLRFDDDDAMVELELISTGGDPEAEARRDEMIAANPEGKPIVTFRYGTRLPPVQPPDAPEDAPSEKLPPDG
jgi:hypothetical protein